MKKLLKQLNIDKDFYFLGQRHDLDLVLKNTKGIHYQFITENELKFYPKISWGVLSIIGFEINVHALLTELNSNKIHINFRTIVRPEHFILMTMFIIIICTSDLINWEVLALIGIWIILHLWFQLVYRYQENKVIDNVAEKLKLKEM